MFFFFFGIDFVSRKQIWGLRQPRVLCWLQNSTIRVTSTNKWVRRNYHTHEYSLTHVYIPHTHINTYVQDYKKIMTALKSVMSVDAKTLYGAEFRAWRALEFSLFVPLHEVLPHFSRLSDHMEVIEDKYVSLFIRFTYFSNKTTIKNKTQNRYYILNANKQQNLKQSPKRSIRSGAPFKQKKNKK